MRPVTNEAPRPPNVVRHTGTGVHARTGKQSGARTHNPSKVDRVPSHSEIRLTATRRSCPQARAAVAPTSSAEGTRKAGACAATCLTPRAPGTLRGACNALTTSIRPLCEQVGRDHRASARLRRTPRLVQDVAALLRFKFLQLSCSKHSTCDIEFPAHWANNAHAVDCRPDLFRNGTADGAVHVLAPLVANGRGARAAINLLLRAVYFRTRSDIYTAVVGD